MRRLQPSEWLARLTGPDHRQVKKTVGRVCQLASGDSSFLEVLREALAQPNDKRVFWIVTHLGSLGREARVAVPELLHLFDREPAGATREAILGAIVDIAPDEPSVKTVVFRALADANQLVRRQALESAIQVTGLSDGDLEIIAKLGADPDVGVATWSEIALRNIRLRRRLYPELPRGIVQP